MSQPLMARIVRVRLPINFWEQNNLLAVLIRCMRWKQTICAREERSRFCDGLELAKTKKFQIFDVHWDNT